MRRFTLSLIARRHVTSALLVLMAGCGSDAAAPATPVLAGAWSLTALNGNTLPYLLSSSGTTRVEATGATLTIAQGNGYSITFGLRSTTNGVATVSNSTDVGTYTLTGAALLLHSTVDGSVLPGTLESNTKLTIVEPGLSYTFTR